MDANYEMQSRLKPNRAGLRLSISEEKVSDIIGRIYEAGADNDAWVDVIEQLRLAFQGSRACLTRFVHGSIDTIQTIHDPDFLCADALRAFRDDPLSRKANLLPQGRSYLQAQLIDQSSFRRGELWNEWYEPRDMYGGLSANLKASDGGYWFFDVQRGARQAEFDLEDTRLLDLFVRHILQAGEIAAKAYHRSLETAVSVVDHGVFILTPDCDVVHCNASAEENLKRALWPLYSSSGRLRCRSAYHERLLQRAIRACGEDPFMENDTPAIFVKSSQALDDANVGVSGLMLRALPLHNRYDFGIRGRTFVALSVRELGREPVGDLFQEIGRSFGLTPAELRLAHRVASGHTLKSTAAALGISITTARHHLQQIFGKTGARQQSQLVALFRPG